VSVQRSARCFGVSVAQRFLRRKAGHLPALILPSGPPLSTSSVSRLEGSPQRVPHAAVRTADENLRHCVHHRREKRHVAKRAAGLSNGTSVSGLTSHTTPRAPPPTSRGSSVPRRRVAVAAVLAKNVRCDPTKDLYRGTGLGTGLGGRVRATQCRGAGGA
jgi:hypothetical protein